MSVVLLHSHFRVEHVASTGDVLHAKRGTFTRPVDPGCNRGDLALPRKDCHRTVGSGSAAAMHKLSLYGDCTALHSYARLSCSNSIVPLYARLHTRGYARAEGLPRNATVLGIGCLGVSHLGSRHGLTQVLTHCLSTYACFDACLTLV